MSYPYNNVYGAYTNNMLRPTYYGPQTYAPQQFIQQPMQQPVAPAELPITAVRFLTADQIKGYIVLPNSKEMLIDKESGLAYIRSANQMGESETKTYKFEELSEKPEPEVKVEYVKAESFDEYVKKLEAKISDLEKKVKIKDILGDKE